MWHRLRIAATSLCLVLCIGFVALWMESYYSQGALYWSKADSSTYILVTTNGLVEFWLCYKSNVQGQADGITSVWSSYPRDIGEILVWHKESERMEAFGFLYGSFPSYWIVTTPHWFLVLLTGGLAILSKPKPRFRFSLRELLLLTTIAAVVLGAVAALGQMGS